MFRRTHVAVASAALLGALSLALIYSQVGKSQTRDTPPYCYAKSMGMWFPCEAVRWEGRA